MLKTILALSKHVISCLRTGSFRRVSYWTSESTTDCALMVTEDGVLLLIRLNEMPEEQKTWEMKLYICIGWLIED